MDGIYQNDYVDKLCKCGCGNSTPIAKYNNKNRNMVKGYPTKFIRGHSRKGVSIPHSEKTKKKIREKQEAWRKSDKYKFFIERQRKRGKNSPTKFKNGHKPYTSGKNLIGLQVGQDHWNWKGGITPEVIRLRGTAKYIKWRKATFERDNYTCQDCGERGVYLEADHYPISFSILFKEKNWKTMWDINNGRTLCRKCHDKTKWKKKNKT